MPRAPRPLSGKTLSFLGPALVALLTTCAPGAAEHTPHVILICIDTLRADRVGAYGYDARPLTPNIDALARDGIRFERCISAAPWTTPSVMSLMSACYPSTHGLTASFLELWNAIEGGQPVPALDPARPTLPAAMKRAGRATAAFTGGMTLPAGLGFGNGFDLYDTSMYRLNDDNMASMLLWIDEHAHEPSFLFWHTFEVHAPYLETTYLGEVVEGGALARSRTRLDALAREAEAEAPDFGKLAELCDEAAGDPDLAGRVAARAQEALYCGGIRSADEWLGRLIGHLKQLGLYDSTLIVLTSDHGEEFADHDPTEYTNGHGHSLYDELVHVPLILKLPGQELAGTSVAQQVRSIDVMPTILDLVGAPLPDGLDGIPLRDTWDGTPDAERIAISESLQTFNEMKAVRTEQYTYIVSVQTEVAVEEGRSALPGESASRELYDHLSDPDELRSLLGAPAAPEIEAEAQVLEALLRAYLTSRPSPPGSVRLDPGLLEILRALGYAGERH
jgi:arylsulfatase A-like enzyme